VKLSLNPLFFALNHKKSTLRALSYCFSLYFKLASLLTNILKLQAMRYASFKTRDVVESGFENGKKILFATVAADGHVNPLTGLAVYLKSIGYDVRWYTSNVYAQKIRKLQIPHYPFVKALDVRGDNVDELLPERANRKSMIAKLNFDIINFFIARSTEYFADIKDIYKEFRFDLMISDCCFTAVPFVKEKLKVPVIAMGVIPLTETSKDLPPAGLGLTPSHSILGRVMDAALRWVADKILFAKSTKALKVLAETHSLQYNNENIFDYIVKNATMLLQSGTPGFEYFRSDIGSNVRFVGPLLPYSSPTNEAPWFDERLNKYDKIILVTQGTVEKNIEKILVPALEAFKGSDVLVLATTGGSSTNELRERYPQQNIIIEDHIPFADVMPYCDAFVSNGGYGGVLLAIENELPCVVAGIHEGKSEICARVGYFELGINLRTETPKPHQIKKSVQEIFRNPEYRKNATLLASEFRNYNTNELCASYIENLLMKERVIARGTEIVGEKIY
jgi:MGT family glycosyltransferase